MGREQKVAIATDKLCPKCGANLVIKMGRFGKFLCLPKFHECKHTENLEPQKPAFDVEIPCPNAGTGLGGEKPKSAKFSMAARPTGLRLTAVDKPTGEKCEKCGNLMITTKRGLIKCSNKECNESVKLKAKNEK